MSQTIRSVKRLSEEKISWLIDSIALRYSMERLHVMAEMLRGRQAIVLDYPVKSVPRYGYGKPPHAFIEEIIQRNEAQYIATLESFLRFKEKLLSIPTRTPLDSAAPCWINGFIPGLDAVALYSLVALNKPQRYFEIGSGNSTKFAKKAIVDNALSTSITSIDPEPRANISAICNTMIRKPVEEVDLSLFDQLEENDILFIDNSHRCYMNSDVTVVFLEILPRLKAGVLVEFHDIALPWDYPPAYIGRYYSEQYLLAVLLLAKSKSYEVVLPNSYLSRGSQLNHTLDPLWHNPVMKNVETHGCPFWIKKVS